MGWYGGSEVRERVSGVLEIGYWESEAHQR